ncbi:GTP-binding protein, partial [Pelagibacteraceae bacterium]|nr:GTP-binding protein [Pelagibacteraceae bacterium]
AIVSEVAGTTRDVIETHLNIEGYPVIVSDTAGIRESKDEIEKKGVKLALKTASDADLRIVVIEPKNLNFTGFLKHLFDKNSLLVINKCDLEQITLDEQFKKLNPILISIKNNTNIDELILNIKNLLKKNFINRNDIFITRQRHRQHLGECAVHLENFSKKNDIEDYDKAAEDLRLATRHLGMIVGKVDVEEILESIFNDFCIGK